MVVYIIILQPRVVKINTIVGCKIQFITRVSYMRIDRLREIREDKDLTQTEIAKLLKISQQQYNKYELGINSIPIEKLDILANFYNTSIDYLVSRTDIRKSYPVNEITFNK